VNLYSSKQAKVNFKPLSGGLKHSILEEGREKIRIFITKRKDFLGENCKRESSIAIVIGSAAGYKPLPPPSSRAYPVCVSVIFFIHLS
jgi:hypothetical protein